MTIVFTVVGVVAAGPLLVSTTVYFGRRRGKPAKNGSVCDLVMVSAEKLTLVKPDESTTFVFVPSQGLPPPHTLTSLLKLAYGAPRYGTVTAISKVSKA